MNCNSENSIKKIKGIVLTMFLVLAWNLCYSHDPDTTVSFYLKDTILIAAEPDYPPYSIIGEDGNADGFSVELFKAAAKAAGLEVIIKTGLWAGIRTELAEGKIDALPVVGRTPEREEYFDFTMPYLTLHGAAFARKKDKSFKTFDDLKNKEIIVMKGDNSEEFVRRINLSENIITTNTFEEAFNKLANGEGDVVIAQQIVGFTLLEQMNLKSVVPLSFPIPGFRQDFCFAVKKGNSELLARLNEGLSIVIANGTFDKIHHEWFGAVILERIRFAQILRIVIIVFLPLAIVIGLFLIFYLRRAVSKQTRELNNEIVKHKKTLMVLERQKILLGESEMQIRLLLNSTAEGIYGIDTNGNCTVINKSAMQMLGFQKIEEVLGRNMHELIHSRRADGSICSKQDCKIYQAFRIGKGTHADDEVFWRIDGRPFHVEYFSHPIIQNEIVIGSVVTFWDITERKAAHEEMQRLTQNLEEQVKERTTELEEKVQKLNKNQKAMLYMVEDLNRITHELKEERRKLEQSNRELDAFSYSVSHDLRAPLRAIDGFSRFLAEDYMHKLDDEGKRFLNIIRESAIKMDNLISDILRLSRVSRAELKFSNVDMWATARSMFLEIASDQEKEDFTFEINPLPNVVCDFGLIKQVWQNLIANALKYSSKSETKKIEIGAEKKDAKTIFFVKDYGAGYDPRYQHKLFGVFQRLHSDEEFEGTGVGLAIINRIIQRHGGDVWSESEPGKGATFYFSLNHHESKIN